LILKFPQALSPSFGHISADNHELARADGFFIDYYSMLVLLTARGIPGAFTRDQATNFRRQKIGETMKHGLTPPRRLNKSTPRFYQHALASDKKSMGIECLLLEAAAFSTPPRQ
jgi:hypothetical protein